MVVPIHIADGPISVIEGFPIILTCILDEEAQPVDEVNVRVTCPLDKPVTTPALVTVATVMLLLLQVPPVVGDNEVVKPTQMVAGPDKLIKGVAFTVTGVVKLDIHPVSVSVK